MANKDFAIENILNGKLKEGFSELSEVFESEGSDENLISELREAFFTPNLEQLKQNFNNNSELLRDYPYIFEKLFVEPEQNRYILFPLDENLYYGYDTQEKKLFPMEVNSDRETKYFFKDLDNPLFVEDEFNEFNLKFLNDNVRDSYDYAGDNHIYFWYENADLFSLLLYYSDLKPLLEYKKFVFLVGEERDKYPIDFKSEFGIDYNSMTPQKIRIDELKRICYWVFRSFSGMSFVLSVLDKNPYLLANFYVPWVFHWHTKYKGEALLDNSTYIALLNDTKTKYTVKKLTQIINNPQIKFEKDNQKTLYLEIIDWIREFTKKDSFTLPELFRGSMLYLFYKKAPDFNPRIIPAIVFDFHSYDTLRFLPVSMTFPYRVSLNCIRYPIITMGQSYKQIHEPYQIFSDYLTLLRVPNELRKVYSVVKFEDLKLYPEETSKALCEYLCVPYTSKMIQDDELVPQNVYSVEASDKPKSIFDKSTLYRNVDSVLSNFDQVRLQIFYDPILRHYGYPAFDFESCPMKDNEIEFLFKFPFKFEKDCVEDGRWGWTDTQQLRLYLHTNMVNFWRAARQGQIHFPPVIRPKIDDKKEDDT